MTRANVSLLVLGLASVLLLLLAPQGFFLIFAASLVALFLGGGGAFLSRHLPLSYPAGVVLFTLLLLCLGVMLGLAFAPAISDQIDALSADLPERIATLRQRISSIGWLDRALSAAFPDDAAAQAAPVAARTAAAGLAALGSFAVLVFLAIYGALHPDTYRNGLLRLLSPDLRPPAHEVTGMIATTLRGWIVARLFSVAVVGALTTFGLWLIGIPLALLLGLVAGLSGFIPNLGPVLAAIPALLIASVDGGTAMLMVAALYLGIQMVETYALTPFVEQHETDMPPALILAAQLVLGLLYGLPGLALASPLAAALMVLLRETYVRRYLEARVSPQARISAPRR